MKKERKIKAVIFDLGSTLVKRKGYAYDFLKKKTKLNVDFDTFSSIHSRLFKKKVWTDVAKGLEQLSRACKREDIFFKKQLEYIWSHDGLFYELYPGSIPLLKMLRKRNYLVVMITNWSQNVLQVIDYHKLRPYFHHLSISAYERLAKPDIRFFKRTLQHIGVKPSEALMVGDKLKKDYLPAKRLGMHALLLERKKKKHQHSIRNLKQIVTYLKKINTSTH